MVAQKPHKGKSADALRSIGEAAAELDLQTHVLRYWEGKFPKHIKPIKRHDGRRMFRPQDMDALRAVKLLVHERGMTLRGAKALLAEQGVSTVLSGDARLVTSQGHGTQPDTSTSPARQLQQTVGAAFNADIAETEMGSTERLRSVLVEITDLKRRLDEARARYAA